MQKCHQQIVNVVKRIAGGGDRDESQEDGTATSEAKISGQRNSGSGEKDMKKDLPLEDDRC